MAVFILFMFSFDYQADLSAYTISSIRPIWLISAFIFCSVATIIFLFAILHKWTGIYGDTVFVCSDGKCTTNSIVTKDIWECIYFSVITLTTVGYGDYHPMNSAISHLIAGAEALSGYIILGVLVSSLANMLRGR
jgi:hypothetical protein